MKSPVSRAREERKSKQDFDSQSNFFPRLCMNNNHLIHDPSPYFNHRTLCLVQVTNLLLHRRDGVCLGDRVCLCDVEGVRGVKVRVPINWKSESNVGTRVSIK